MIYTSGHDEYYQEKVFKTPSKLYESYKIQSGEYYFRFENKIFWLARVNAITQDDDKNYDDSWQLCEVLENGQNDYWNHFSKKWQALEAATGFQYASQIK